MIYKYFLFSIYLFNVRSIIQKSLHIAIIKKHFKLKAEGKKFWSIITDYICNVCSSSILFNY